MPLNTRSSVPKESGFTLIEVMVAGLVLTTGLLILAYGYGQGLASVVTAQEDTVAREKCRETLESVMTALNTNNLTFNSICNVSQGAGCIFVDGFTPVYYAGNDGIYGTADDAGPCTAPAQCGIQTYVMPGPDGVLGTADDITVSLSGTYLRKIDISAGPVTNTRQITVTVQFTTSSGQTRSVVMTSYASPYT
jgi:type II secretory pathway pseudopilin PulG